MTDLLQSCALMLHFLWKLATYCAWPLGMIAALALVLYLFFQIEKRKQA